jgi:hypothetical protein
VNGTEQQIFLRKIFLKIYCTLINKIWFNNFTGEDRNVKKVNM